MVRRASTSSILSASLGILVYVTVGINGVPIHALNPDILGHVKSGIATSVKDDHQTIMSDAWHFWHEMFRHPESNLYCDQVHLDHGLHNSTSNGCDGSYISAASCGWGLVLLAVGTEMNYTDKATAKQEAEHAIKLATGQWPRGEAGFMFHWVAVSATGSLQRASDDLSTIDSAILVLGALFIGNYFENKFGDSELLDDAKVLASSVAWPKAITDEGVRAGGKNTLGPSSSPWNEYYLPAYLATVFGGEGVPAAQRHFLTSWTPECSSGVCEYGDKWKSTGLAEIIEFDLAGAPQRKLFSDGPRIQSSFQPQFLFFLVRAFNRNDTAVGQFWNRYFTDYAQADMAYWTEELLPGNDYFTKDAHKGGADLVGKVWGSGPGQTPSCLYAVNAIRDIKLDVHEGNHNLDKVFSTAIMAGFLAADQPGTDGNNTKHKIVGQLDSMWRENTCTYHVTSATSASAAHSIMWRCAAATAQRGWKADTVVMDWVNFPLGYAAHMLGSEFYRRHAY